jgi:alanine racemase
VSPAGEVVVDLGAVAANTAELARRAGAAQVMAVVKGDAYGHGLVPCARAALAGGAAWLGVAQLDEALALRAAGVTAPVLAWLYGPAQPLDAAVAAGVDVSASAPWAVAAAAAAAARTGAVARVHLKVDTGLGRGGSTTAEWPALVAAALAAQAEGAVEVVAAWSHFAFADDPDHATVRAQERVFAEALAVGEALGARWPLRHLANSAATLTNPGAHLDLVRPGIAVYGLSPVPHLGGPAAFGLRPAMTLRAPLALVKDVPAGQGVSYAHAHTTTAPTRLGLVPLGYADGIPRHAGGDGSAPAEHPGGPVRVAGGTARVAGRVCMDQFVVDLAGLPGAAEAAAGDPVVVFGDGLDGSPTAEDWARAAGTIGYEVVTRISSRLPRRYVGDPGAAPGPATGAERAP